MLIFRAEVDFALEKKRGKRSLVPFFPLICGFEFQAHRENSNNLDALTENVETERGAPVFSSNRTWLSVT